MKKKWFHDRGVKKVISVDHPLWTTYGRDLKEFNKEMEVRTPLRILLLPGSRRFEVEKLLPIFIESIRELKKDFPLKVLIVKSSSVPAGLYDAYQEYFDHEFTNERLTDALKTSDFALAASGTVTLTCALYEVPTVVCYKTSLLNQFIYETVVSYRGFVSLANIIQNRSVFPELLQDQVSAYNIVSFLRNWYYNKQACFALKNQLKETKFQVQGEPIDIPKYMAEVLDYSYGKKVDTTH